MPFPKEQAEVTAGAPWSPHQRNKSRAASTGVTERSRHETTRQRLTSVLDGSIFRKKAGLFDHERRESARSPFIQNDEGEDNGVTLQRAPGRRRDNIFSSGSAPRKQSAMNAFKRWRNTARSRTRDLEPAEPNIPMGLRGGGSAGDSVETIDIRSLHSSPSRGSVRSPSVHHSTHAASEGYVTPPTSPHREPSRSTSADPASRPPPPPRRRYPTPHPPSRRGSFPRDDSDVAPRNIYSEDEPSRGRPRTRGPQRRKKKGRGYFDGDYRPHSTGGDATKTSRAEEPRSPTDTRSTRGDRKPRFRSPTVGSPESRPSRGGRPVTPSDETDYETDRDDWSGTEDLGHERLSKASA